MLSLRSTVIALVASAGLVLVLAGVLSGVFTTEPSPPPVGQSVSVHQDGAAPAPASPVPPDIAAPAPAVAAPAAPAPVASVPATPAPASATVPSEPVTHDHQVQVQQQAAPTAHPAVSDAPAENHRPVSPPPPSALPAHEAKSRTVNTEPCACDGTMRKVPTHWDPPEG